MIKKMLGYILGGMFSIILTGYLTSLLMTDLVPAFITGDWERLWKPELMLQSSTWIYGIAVTVMMVMLYMVFHVGTVKRAKRLLKAKEDSIESSLENSRFMTDKERDANLLPESLQS